MVTVNTNFLNQAKSNPYQVTENWNALLQDCRPKDTNQPHKVIVSKGSTVCTLPSGKTHDRDSQKLPVEKITEISKQILLEALESQKLSNDINTSNFLKVDKFLKQAEEIIGTTEAMIQAKHISRNQPLKKIGRGIALVLSALSSVVLIGIPFLIRLRQDEKTYTAEISKLYNDVLKMRRMLESVGSERLRVERFNKNIREFGVGLLRTNFKYDDEAANQLMDVIDIRSIVPDITDEMYDEMNGRDIDIDSRNALITKLSVFLRDVEQNRKTLELSLEAAASYSHLKQEFHSGIMPKLNANQQRTEGLKREYEIILASPPKVLKEIDEFNLSEEESAWLPILQSAHQTSSSIALSDINFRLNTLTLPVTWTNGMNETHRLSSEIPAKAQTTHFEMIRDAENKLTKVKVTVKGRIDLVKKKEPSKVVAEVVVPRAVTAELTYFITLDNSQPRPHPIVSDLTCVYQSNIPKI